MKPSAKRTKNFRNRPRILVTSIVVACVVLAIGAVAVASRGKSDAVRPSQLVAIADDAQRTAQTAPLHIQDDPQELSSDEAEKLAAGLKDLVNQSTEGLVEAKHADGSVSLDLQGRFQSVTVARINKDGSITQSCVDNPQAAAAFFEIDPKLIDKTAETAASRKAKVTPAPARN